MNHLKLTERPTFGALKLTADDCRAEAAQYAAQAADSEGQAKTYALDWAKRWNEYADALRRREEMLKRNGYTW